jgi:hypothetical protein
VREDARPSAAHVVREIVLRLAREKLRRALHEAFGVAGEPRVVEREVVRDEIEEEAEAQTPQTFAQFGQPFVAAERRVNAVVVNRVRRADDIPLGAVGQGAAKLFLPAGVRARDPARGGAALPDAHQPHGVETIVRDPPQLRVRHAAERQRLPPAQLVQPHPRVDFVDGRALRPKAHLPSPFEPRR